MKRKVKWSEGRSLLSENNADFLNFMSDVSEFRLSEMLCSILYNRDINTYEKVKNHLFMELNDIHNPSLLKDSDKFVEAVKKAINEKHKVVIMGDYDVDGVTATAISVLGLRRLGLDVDFYINNRFVEGYGMTPLSLENILKKYPNTKTIITVDNGIVAFEAVKLAMDKGIQVVVTDHHEPSSDGKYPEAVAVVDQKREDCEYPFKELCGAGVIFKLLILLYWELDRDIEEVFDYLDLLAVGTIADVVSLTDENRVFVKEGLELIKNNHRLFFKILGEKMEVSNINEETVGFQYGPAINAIGRLKGCPSIVVEAMVSNDVGFISKVCDEMIATNDDRKEITKIQVAKSEDMLARDGIRDVIVVYDESFQEGVVGLIAGRLCERYYKPVVALTKHGDKIKGSARSIPGFDIKKSFDYCADVLLGYGGHPQAGGLSLEVDKLEAFIEKINEYAKINLTPEISKKVVSYDKLLSKDDLNGRTIDEIDRLRPYGQGFKKPLFGYKSTIPISGFYDKTDSNTLILTGSDNSRIVGFDNKEQYIKLGKPSKIALLGCPAINIYKGNISYQFIISEDNIKAYRDRS